MEWWSWAPNAGTRAPEPLLFANLPCHTDETLAVGLSQSKRACAF